MANKMEATMNIVPGTFQGLQNPNAVKIALATFLKNVPNGTRVHLPHETTVVLEQICSALPNMITAEIIKFNDANCLDVVH
jgi:hypothetical protein